MSLGITVHGLKEKLTYLEGVHEENLKKEMEKKRDEQIQRKMIDDEKNR